MSYPGDFYTSWIRHPLFIIKREPEMMHHYKTRTLSDEFHQRILDITQGRGSSVHWFLDELDAMLDPPNGYDWGWGFADAAGDWVLFAFRDPKVAMLARLSL